MTIERDSGQKDGRPPAADAPVTALSPSGSSPSVSPAAPLQSHGAKIGPADLERLGDLIFGFDQVVRAGRDPESGVAPIDCGGSNGSDHSYRFSRLVKMGFAEHRKRGMEWGKAPTRWRGSKMYRPTEAGRAALAKVRP